ncbi:MAG: hypothetical protein K2X27_18285 [Candidatus Obscuribacterales bacterium]|nr:hypothetical protein [Candidatus Obscuribacterales bacterium]
MAEIHDVSTMPFPVKPVNGNLPQFMTHLQAFIQILADYSEEKEKELAQVRNELYTDTLALIDIRIQAAKKQNKI